MKNIKVTKTKENKGDVYEVLIENLEKPYVNSLRLCIDLYIPSYAFHRSNIKIDNESLPKHIYNNDQMYNNLEQLPIFDLEFPNELDNPELYISDPVMKTLFTNFLPTYEKEQTNEIDNNKKLLNIEISVAKQNKNSEMIYITSHDLNLKVNNVQSDSYKKKRKITLFSLNPGEVINFSAKASLGLSVMSSIYSMVISPIVYNKKKESDLEYYLKFATVGQQTKEVIVHKACSIIKQKLLNIRNYIQKKYGTSKHTIFDLVIYGESYCIANILERELQNHIGVDKVACPVSYNKFTLILHAADGYVCINILIDVLNKLYDLYEHLQQIL